MDPSRVTRFSPMNCPRPTATASTTCAYSSGGAKRGVARVQARHRISKGANQNHHDRRSAVTAPGRVAAADRLLGS
jgi:hypothetical protein